MPKNPFLRPYIWSFPGWYNVNRNPLQGFQGDNQSRNPHSSRVLLLLLPAVVENQLFCCPNVHGSLARIPQALGHHQSRPVFLLQRSAFRFEWGQDTRFLPHFRVGLEGFVQRSQNTWVVCGRCINRMPNVLGHDFIFVDIWSRWLKTESWRNIQIFSLWVDWQVFCFSLL